MNLLKCENGHFYDADRFNVCPHCNKGVGTLFYDAGGEAHYTEVYQEKPPIDPTRTDTTFIIDPVTEDDSQKTIGYFGEIEKQPVVGWFVAISGKHTGEDFRLKTGRNFIGRAMDMDVALTDDASISRNKHAIILHEPRSNMFLVQPGDAKELCYLNDKVVLTAVEIKANDILSLGETKLIFIPLCTDVFNWNMTKEEN